MQAAAYMYCKKNNPIVFCWTFSAGAQQVHTCDFANPHSIGCQELTYSGQVFPLLQVRDWGSRQWKANQIVFQPEDAAAFGALYTTAHHPHIPFRTCGVQNVKAGNAFVGKLIIQFSEAEPNKIENISIEGWKEDGGTFTSNVVRFQPEMPETLSFANTESSETFHCRDFLRVGNEHLHCKYIKDGEPRGFVGFLTPLGHAGLNCPGNP